MLKVEVKETILLDKNVKILNFVNDLISEEIKSELGIESRKTADEISFQLTSEVLEVSYIHYGGLSVIGKVVKL